jgi:hypothetical protein
VEEAGFAGMSLHQYCRPGARKRILAGEFITWVHGKKRCKYIMTLILSFPYWVDKKEIMRLHKQVKKRTKETGQMHSLDHIIPLRHPRVCGLSVPINLRVITHAANMHKSNAWCEWHGELFDEPEQLRLL